MKTKGICVIMLLILPFTASSQTPKQTQKAVEFGITSCDDWMALSENLSSMLREDESSLGYIVYYGGRINIPPYGKYTQRLPRLC